MATTETPEVSNLSTAEGSAATLLGKWLKKRISAENSEWLSLQIEKILKSESNRDLHITLGLIPRKLLRTDLELSDAELTEAKLCHSGWNPSTWSTDTAARVAVLCTVAENDNKRFEDLLHDLFRNADLAESIAYYSGVSVYPHSDVLDWQIGEGLRSNIRAVFEAIAHNSPYPALHFDQNRWNHMVLKALFIDSTLSPVVGLDQRANPELALILTDYAHERWAAGRPVNPELWRCVGRFATGQMIEDLERVITSSDVVEQQAGALALSQCPEDAAQSVLSRYPDLATLVNSGSITWDHPGSANISRVGCS